MGRKWTLWMVVGTCAAALTTAPSTGRARARPAPPVARTALQELASLKERLGPNLAKIRAGNAWCLDDDQLAELQRQKRDFATSTTYMSAPQQAHLILAIEVAYQTRMAAGRTETLRHALAVARVLVSIRAEAEVVEAALLADVCDNSGIEPVDVKALLGCEPEESGTNSAWQVGLGVSKVWRLSELLERSSLEDSLEYVTDGLVLAADGPGAAPAANNATAGPGGDGGGGGAAGMELSEAEQLERQCQILLAGCDLSDSIIVSLASRLVSMRELQGALAGKPLRDAELSAAPRRSESAEGGVQPCLLDQAEACAAFVRAGGDAAMWRALAARKDAFARQTLEVFVPLAERLGMWYFKTELETLAFAISSPHDFAALSATLLAVRARAEPSIAAAQAELEAALAADPVLRVHVRKLQVRSRVKDAYSVWRKMRRKGLEAVEELGDVLAFRFILSPAATGGMSRAQWEAHQAGLCYRALEVVHGVLPMALAPPSGGGTPLRLRDCGLRDYIHYPKPNGYRSLHSKALVGGAAARGAAGGAMGGALLAEVQVRTIEMHSYAEYGRAAHWLYKHDAGRREVAEDIWTLESAYQSVPGLRRERGRAKARQTRTAARRLLVSADGGGGARAQLVGPNLGPLEPPLWLGRAAMLTMTLLALNADFAHDGGLMHDFVELPATRVEFDPAVPAAVDEAVDEPFVNLATDLTVLGAFPSQDEAT